MDILSKALAVYRPIADNYAPKPYINYITKSSNKYPIHSDNMDDTGSEEYCCDCIKDAIDNYRKHFYEERMRILSEMYEIEHHNLFHKIETVWNGKEYIGVRLKRKVIKKDQRHLIPGHLKAMRKKLREEYRANTLFDYRYYHSSDKNGDAFCHCDSCGEMFDKWCHLDEQEVEHWEDFKVDELKEMLLTPYHAWQICRVIEDAQQNDKYRERIEKVVSKILAT